MAVVEQKRAHRAGPGKHSDAGPLSVGGPAGTVRRITPGMLVNHAKGFWRESEQVGAVYDSRYEAGVAAVLSLCFGYSPEQGVNFHVPVKPSEKSKRGSVSTFDFVLSGASGNGAGGDGRMIIEAHLPALAQGDHNIGDFPTWQDVRRYRRELGEYIKRGKTSEARRLKSETKKWLRGCYRERKVNLRDNDPEFQGVPLVVLHGEGSVHAFLKDHGGVSAGRIEAFSRAFRTVLRDIPSVLLRSDGSRHRRR